MRLFESSTLSERKLSDVIKQYAVEIPEQAASDRPRMDVSSALGGENCDVWTNK